MSKVTLKNMPKLKLGDLLRRRKMSLRQLLDEFGLTTYEGLVIRCTRMGVLPPTEADFKVAFPIGPVNSPTEGVIVVEAPPVIDDITGRKIDPEAPAVPEVRVITEPLGQLLTSVQTTGEVDVAPPGEPTEPPQKKLRKKKEATQGE